MVLKKLHEKCSTVVESSLSAENELTLGRSYIFASDLEGWREAMSDPPNENLLETASAEYLLAILNICQGQYRNGFKGLRLVLELCIQSIHLSANLMLRQEWIKGEQDTIWASLVDEDNGPLSKRFCNAFFPELGVHAAHFRSLARTLYRELSECIHGNVPNHIPLPTSLVFSQETFDLWHAKAKLVRRLVIFSFALRYLRTMPMEKKSLVEAALIEELGHIDVIRMECQTGA
ncbi:hypothetical protein ACUXVY_22440 [Chromobacterium haemolyticum]|uniref:hypothetical protein n=1 Tax=Chromobacterium haemolyticum TaxID=394935 RepID=UPI004057A3D1